MAKFDLIRKKIEVMFVILLSLFFLSITAPTTVHESEEPGLIKSSTHDNNPIVASMDFNLDKNNGSNISQLKVSSHEVHSHLVQSSDKLDNIKLRDGKPESKLLGKPSATVEKGASYKDAGASAIDNKDGDSSKSILTSNAVDTNMLGTYTVSYNAIDSERNSPIEVVRPVYVVPKVSESNRTLIFYDDAGPYGDRGIVYAMFLQNLLGHFTGLEVILKPTSQYQLGEMADAKTVFYLGTTYDPLSFYTKNSREAGAYHYFYQDIALLDKTVVWMNYNLNSLENFWLDKKFNNRTFPEQYGISFQDIKQSQYNRVKYKNTELFKGVIPFATPGASVTHCADEGDNRYACALEINEINIVDADKIKVFATSYSTLNATTKEIPYITKAKNFWFVGDIPFTYISEEDRYLAFADVLHDILEIDHVESHKAIMRLEDVDARTSLTSLNDIANYMKSKKIPFSVATIPRYEDPLGIENNGIPTTELISNSTVGSLLKKLYDAGSIDIVQHGTTHQYHEHGSSKSETLNPYNGLSGDDFEFMRVIETDPNKPYSYLYPTMGDSGKMAKARIIEGRSILSSFGLTAFAWEAPHYMAGPNHYRSIAEIYPVQYARILYYPYENHPDKTKENQFFGQFYPYIIQKDIYGYTVIPENIHNVDAKPNPGYRPVQPEDVTRFSKKLKVVRDAVASFYYHPYLGSKPLKKIVEGVEKEGYDFVSAPSLIN